MFITTQDNFVDHETVQTLGIVKGNTVRARHIGKDIMAGLRNIVGGEILEYTKMLAEAREQSLDRMIEEARKLGADGIVAMRMVTSTAGQTAAEILAYGTAVKLRKK
jgi:uncharacterized protein YbjQ (UPF0145 family)